jgi:T-complex protein 1 subunit gamma
MGPERQSGRKAQTANIVAAKVHPFCKYHGDWLTLTDGRRCHQDMSRTQGDVEDDFGPYGWYLVSVEIHHGGGEAEIIRLTNDGHAILREIDVAHPAAKSMIELSRTQDEEVGDGTTSVIILGVYLP